MKKTTIAASLILAPMVAFAQASGSASTSTQASVSGSSAASGGRKLSADAQARVDGSLQTAREKRLPEEPIRERVAEGRAKGASDAQVALASERAVLDLETSFNAMVRAGRRAPSDEEVTRGAQLFARGYTSAQVEGVARRAPSDRSLVVAFETLTSLQAGGASTVNAVARIEGLLAARASDVQLQGAANGNAKAAGGVGNVAGAMSGGVSGNAGAAGAGAVGGATAGVSGTVGGVLGGRKP